VSSDLGRVREVARKDKDARFTALLHHVTPELLERSFRSLKKDAAPGADGVRWRDYERGVPVRLLSLHERAQQGKYRAVPSRRVYIPKADGRQRPLGIATDDSYCPSCNRVSGCSRPPPGVPHGAGARPAHRGQAAMPPGRSWLSRAGCAAQSTCRTSRVVGTAASCSHRHHRQSLVVAGSGEVWSWLAR
jgi:hypothetical protein